MLNNSTTMNLLPMKMNPTLKIAHSTLRTTTASITITITNRAKIIIMNTTTIANTIIRTKIMIIIIRITLVLALKKPFPMIEIWKATAYLTPLFTIRRTCKPLEIPSSKLSKLLTIPQIVVNTKKVEVGAWMKRVKR